MANVATNWVLNLVDRISGPMKSASHAVDTTRLAVSKVRAALSAMDQAGKAAASTALEDHKALTALLAKEEKKIQSLRKALAIAPKDPLAQGPIQFDISQAETKVRRYKEQLTEVNHELTEIAEKPNPERMKANWGSAMLAANQGMEVISKLTSMMSFASGWKDMEVNVQRMSGLTGSALKGVSTQIYHISEVFGENSDSVSKAANALTKNIGGSFSENLALIQEGYEKGANVNGDMLSQIGKYAGQMKHLGLSGSEAIALMAHAGKDGVFSDKALDALKEAGTSLREMGQPQVNALQGIGLLPSDLAGKTVMQAVGMVSTAMNKAGVTVQQKQKALSSIFKTSGKDAGLEFIQGLENMSLDLSKIEAVKESGSAIKGFFASAKSFIAQHIGDSIVSLTAFSGAFQGIAGMIPIIQALSKVQFIQAGASKVAAGAQWLFNAAMSANPIGLIVIGIAAMAAGIIWAWGKFEGFRMVVWGLWGTTKQVFDNILSLFKAVFAPVGEAIAAMSNGKWIEAALAIAKLNPISTIKRGADFIAGGGLVKGLGAAYDEAKLNGIRPKQAEDKKPASAGGIPTISGSPLLDGIVSDKHKAGDKLGQGMSLGGGAGRSITMNLEIKNYFKQVASSLDVRKVADEVAGVITDRLRDSALSL